MSTQLDQYIPVLILGVLMILTAGGMLVTSLVLGKLGNRTRVRTNQVPMRNVAYECGMLPEGEGNARMSVKFYLVAMLFILFDIEVVFLYPWAVVYREMLVEDGPLILGSMMSFLGILFIGYIYAVKQRAFDWTH